MALQVVEAQDVKVENLVVTIYGQTNIGKTSLALTAEKPIIFDFDGGVHRAGSKKGKPVVRLHSWKEVMAITEPDLKPYRTVIIDTVGTCIDYMIAFMLEEDKKCGSMGIPNQHGYQRLKIMFRDWLFNFRRMGKHVIFVAHMTEESKDDRTVERIIATGASKQEVYAKSDLMGKLYLNQGVRTLTFDLTETSFAKNCGIAPIAMQPLAMIPSKMKEIIDEGVLKLNDEAMKQDEEHQRLEALRAWIMTFTTVEDFNAAVTKMTGEKAKAVDKKILMDIALGDVGLKWDKDKKVFYHETEQADEQADGA